MKKQTIFLASSSELKDDRDQFEIYIGRKNKQLFEKGIFFELILWEDFLDAMSQTRLQDEYNKAISECDIFIMLFFTKVGKYTEEEFDKAFSRFKATSKPKVFTYFKNAPVLTGNLNEDIISLLQFKNKLFQLGHYITTYTSIDDLKFQFDQQLDKLTSDGFIEFEKDVTNQKISTGPCENMEFTDSTVNDVFSRLCKLHSELRIEFLPAEILLPELDALFNRKTFRFEKLRNCPEQRWADRLDSGYQTLRLLECYARNVREKAADKFPLYQKLLREADGYCMQMGTLLFEPSVDYNEIESHIGKSTFKEHLSEQIKFEKGQSKKPIIPDDINDPIQQHCDEAISLMDQIMKKS